MLAVLSDIHSNVHALDAVLTRATALGARSFLVLGDVVGYGPFPNECVELVAGLDAVCVAGNHDRIAVGALTDARCSASARDSLAWTRGVLSDASRQWLRDLPDQRRTGDVVAAHGSLDDVEEYVRRPARAAEQLDEVGLRDASILCLGHTHVAWAFSSDGRERLRLGPGTVQLDPGLRHLLNPGSVGQPRDGGLDARFLLLDGHEASFEAVPYDLEACRAALLAAGRPGDACWSSARLVDRSRAAAGRVLRSIRGRSR